MMQKKPLSVSKLNRYIRGMFEDELLLHSCKFFGEVSGSNMHGGAFYFSLRDENASVACVCFKPNPMSLPKNGDCVCVSGTPRYLERSGRLSFTVSYIAPYEGAGDILLKQKQIKEKLLKEGLFDKKKPKPLIIRTVGVITSSSGAVLHDILNVVKRRQPSLNLLVYDVRVQGDGAEKGIKAAFEYFNSAGGVDALILARGGGSSEDLEAFNTELAARAVAGSRFYTVSAVGHETDFTLCDFAADLRAPTPTAAAELLTIDSKVQRSGVLELAYRLKRALYGQFAFRLKTVHEEVNRLNFLSGVLLMRALGRLKHSKMQLYSKTDALMLGARQAVRAGGEELYLRAKALCASKHEKLRLVSGELNALNPLKLLGRGFVRATHMGKSLTTISRVAKDDIIELAFSDGALSAKVEEIYEKGR